MQIRGMKGDMMWMVVQNEDKGDTMTGDRSEMMMMVVVPDQLLKKRNK